MTELETAETAAREDRNPLAVWERWRTKLAAMLDEIVCDAAAGDLDADREHFVASFDERLPVVDFGCGNAKQTRFLGRLGTEGVVSIISLAERGES
jgi:hypothetical protein